MYLIRIAGYERLMLRARLGVELAPSPQLRATSGIALALDALPFRVMF